MKIVSRVIEKYNQQNDWIQCAIILFMVAIIVILLFLASAFAISIYYHKTPIIEGVLVYMNYVAGHNQLMSNGKISYIMYVPAIWKVRIADQNRINTYSISQDLYNKLKVGDKVIVTDDYWRI